MARLTDSTGTLLGGLDTSPARRFTPSNEAMPVALHAPAAPPLTPDYEPSEIVFALECSYGALTYLTYSSTQAPQASMDARPRPRPYGCDTLVEMPDERHHCPKCGGYYCAFHADPEAHECASVLRSKPRD